MVHVLNRHRILINALLSPARYEHPADTVELIETHISWVLLAGDYAYKIKKPLNLGFLDFSTLEKRQFFCQEELRLNRRLAPEIYLEVVSITGNPETPRWNGEGDAIEYAVRMKRFPQDAQLDRALAKGELHAHHFDAIAELVSEFHRKIAIADRDSQFGTPENVLQPVTENFIQIRQRITEKHFIDDLHRLEQWTKLVFSHLESTFAQRRKEGYIRECHGDLHLRNLAWVNDHPLAFDCIEFNPNLRWIDVMSEVAFLVMDLQDRKQSRFAHRFLNAYLENTGDYSGVRLLPFYLTYRALVRAKVAAIRSAQDDIEAHEQQRAIQEFSEYLNLALGYTRPPGSCLIITRGLSASGKTTLTQALLEQLGAIRIRSDVERKRIFGLHALESGKANPEEGIYTANASKRTYVKLGQLATGILDAGFPVIVDAACLKAEQRKLFRKIAEEKQVPFCILEFTASPETLRQRIITRKKEASDADLAVLAHQLESLQPLDDEEEVSTIRIDTESNFDAAHLAKLIMARCNIQE